MALGLGRFTKSEGPKSHEPTSSTEASVPTETRERRIGWKAITSWGKRKRQGGFKGKVPLGKTCLEEQGGYTS